MSGFAVKVNPTSTTNIEEVWHEDTSISKTPRSYPVTPISNARNEGILYIQKVRQGKIKKEKKQQTLQQIFDKEIQTSTLKLNTIKNYKHVVRSTSLIEENFNKRVLTSTIVNSLLKHKNNGIAQQIDSGMQRNLFCGLRGFRESKKKHT